MSSWIKTNLHSAANLVRSAVVPFTGSTHYIATADVDNFKINPSEEVTFSDRPSRADIQLEVSDVLQAKMKDTNKPVLVNHDMAGWIASTGFARFKPKTTGNSPSYIFHFLSSPFFLRQRDRLSVGSTQQAISDRDLKEISICIPADIKSQNAISNILNLTNTVIENTEALIEKYQQIKLGLMHDLFTRGIGADGKLRPPRELAPELYQHTPIGWIPKQWDFGQLVELVHFQRGYDIVEADFVEGKFPVISSGGVIGFHSKFTSRGPSVVIGRKGTIGKVHYVESDFWAHDTSLFATDLFGNAPLFIYYLCNYLDLSRYGTKSGSPSLNRNDIHPLPVGKPSPVEQEHIVNRLTSCDNKIALLSQDLNKQHLLKFGLMHDLLTGKVQIPTINPEASNV